MEADVSGWRHVELRVSFEQVLYTDQTREEIEALADEFLSDDFIDRFCDCGGEEKFDVDQNPDRWTKSRYFPCCRVQVGGYRVKVAEGPELEDEGDGA